MRQPPEPIDHDAGFAKSTPLPFERWLQKPRARLGEQWLGHRPSAGDAEWRRHLLTDPLNLRCSVAGLPIRARCGDYPSDQAQVIVGQTEAGALRVKVLHGTK